MTYSLQQATDAAGANKSTILRAIQAGKVSATRNEHDQWLIEPAELHRVYPPATAGNRKLNSEGNDTHQSELAEASRSAALAKLDVNLLCGTIEDLAVRSRLLARAGAAARSAGTNAYCALAVVVEAITTQRRADSRGVKPPRARFIPRSKGDRSTADHASRSRAPGTRPSKR